MKYEQVEKILDSYKANLEAKYKEATDVMAKADILGKLDLLLSLRVDIYTLSLNSLIEEARAKNE